MDETGYKIAWLKKQRESVMKMRYSEARERAVALIDEMIAELEEQEYKGEA